jgi:hypothetical protein
MAVGWHGLTSLVIVRLPTPIEGPAPVGIPVLGQVPDVGDRPLGVKVCVGHGKVARKVAAGGAIVLAVRHPTGHGGNPFLAFRVIENSVSFVHDA